jgi:membrane protease YdiL (CAAX protease family)
VEVSLTAPSVIGCPVAARPKILVAVAWIATVLLSSLPNIFVQEVLKGSAAWLLRVKIVLLVSALLASVTLPAVYPLRRFFVVFLALYAAEYCVTWVGRLSGYLCFFGATFTGSMLGSQLVKLAVALLMVAVVLALTRNRRASFLTLSAPGATAKPEWFLPIRRPVPYGRFGPPLALAIGTGTLAFVLLGGHPSRSALHLALPLLPLALLWSAVNAFSEEYSYRASLMATLRSAVGDRQALWLTSVFFGVAHFYGVPYGVLGVGMATCLGYVLGKAMLESEGIFWPWFIHFVQDAVIFVFLAIGAVTAGGR